MIRAIESIRAPLDHEMTLTYISTAVVSTCLIIPLGLIGFNSRLRVAVRSRTYALEEEITERQQIQDSLHEQTLELENEIAERQKSQEKLQKSEAHLKIVADHASNWEYWRLTDNSFMYISPSVYTITGYTVDEFMNDHELIDRIIHPYDRELFKNHNHDVSKDGQILPIEIRIISKNGDVRWMGHVCRQVLTPDGMPWGWRASNQEITARKLLEHQLREQSEHLEKLNHSLEERISKAVSDLRKKDQTLIQQSRLAAMGELIHNISHQWRQPLNNIGLIIQNMLFSYSVVRLGLCMSYFRFWPFEFA